MRFDSINTTPERPPSRAWKTSEDLIDNLEEELGGASTDVARVRISYSHSAFPEAGSPGPASKVSNLRTRLETSAVATLKRHNSQSPWSLPSAIQPNPIFQLVLRHWGLDKATAAMQQMLTQKSIPGETARIDLAPESHTQRGISTSRNNTVADAIVPVRRGSLGKVTNSQVQLSACRSLSVLRPVAANDGRASTPSATFRRVEPERPSSELGPFSTRARQTSELRRRIRQYGANDVRSNGVPCKAEGSNRSQSSIARSSTTSNRQENIPIWKGFSRVKGKAESGFWDWSSWF